jgi:hypothetical protein
MILLEALESGQVAVARVDKGVGRKIICLPGVQLGDMRHLTALQVVEERSLPLE